MKKIAMIITFCSVAAFQVNTMQAFDTIAAFESLGLEDWKARVASAGLYGAGSFLSGVVSYKCWKAGDKEMLFLPRYTRDTAKVNMYFVGGAITSVASIFLGVASLIQFSHFIHPA